MTYVLLQNEKRKRKKNYNVQQPVINLSKFFFFFWVALVYVRILYMLFSLLKYLIALWSPSQSDKFLASLKTEYFIRNWLETYSKQNEMWLKYIYLYIYIYIFFPDTPWTCMQPCPRHRHAPFFPCSCFLAERFFSEGLRSRAKDQCQCQRSRGTF